MADNASSSLFSANLRRLRNRKGYTQEDLAERCESSKNYISQMESGRRHPSHEMLDRLCRALQANPMDFYLPPEGLKKTAISFLVEEETELYSLLQKMVDLAVEKKKEDD
jgi:transcriptional regulator with XRE-family HTH domain